MEVEVPEILRKPLLVPNKNLMGPEPSNGPNTRIVVSNPLLAESNSECSQVCFIFELLSVIFRNSENFEFHSELAQIVSK